MDQNNESISFRSITYFIVNLLIAVAGLIYFSLQVKTGASNFQDFQKAYIIFILLAFIFEFAAVKLPARGLVSCGFAVYLAVIILFGAPYAALLVGVVFLFHALLYSWPNAAYRFNDFSVSVISVLASGFVYDLINKQSQILTFQNIAAVAVAALVYYVLEYIMNSIAFGILAPAEQREWSSARSSLILLNLALVPTGLILADFYKISPWLVLALLPLLWGLHFSFSFGAQKKISETKENIQEKLESVKEKATELAEENQTLTDSLQKKVDEISIFFELSQTLGANLSLDKVLSTIIYMLKKLIYCQSCVIFLLQDGEMNPVKFLTPYKETLEMSHILELKESIVNLVIQKKSPILVPDMQLSDYRIFKDEKSVVCVPLIIQKEVIGVIYIGEQASGSFSEEQLQIAMNLANASAIAIKSAQLLNVQERALGIQQRINEQLDNKIKQLSTLSDFGKSLGATLNLAETLKLILEMTKKMIDYQTCIIFGVQGDAELEFVPLRYNSPYVEYIRNLKIKFHQGILGWVATNRKPFLLEDISNSVLPNILEYERSVLIVPLVAENQVTGLIYFGQAMPGSFTKEHLDLIVPVAYQAAMAIKNAEFYERISAMAITDGLTGLYTHRYFQERLEEEIRWAERYQRPLSLIFVDLDNFKQYNDTLGHPAGDAFLKEVSKLLRSFTRESDLVCRYGGDEFALILMNIGKEEALLISERIREGFHQFFKDYPVNVTPSMGVANFPVDAVKKVDLVSKVDIAAYKAKRSGKDKIIAADPLGEDDKS